MDIIAVMLDLNGNHYPLLEEDYSAPFNEYYYTRLLITNYPLIDVSY
jgi:hypothetical protein